MCVLKLPNSPFFLNKGVSHASILASDLELSFLIQASIKLASPNQIAKHCNNEKGCSCRCKCVSRGLMEASDCKCPGKGMCRYRGFTYHDGEV